MTKFPPKLLPRKLVNHATLQPSLTQLGWTILPATIMTARVKGTIHTTTTKQLQNLHIPTTKIRKLLETISHIAIRNLIHIILNECKTRKHMCYEWCPLNGPNLWHPSETNHVCDVDEFYRVMGTCWDIYTGCRSPPHGNQKASQPREGSY